MCVLYIYIYIQYIEVLFCDIRKVGGKITFLKNKKQNKQKKN